MHHQFQAQQLRTQSVVKAVESIAVFVFALFTSALLPSLLFRYLYANQELTEQPKMLEYIPVAAFVVGVAYFVYAMVGNWARDGKARRLEQEAIECGCDDCGCDCEPSSPAAPAKKSVKFKTK